MLGRNRLGEDNRAFRSLLVLVVVVQGSHAPDALAGSRAFAAQFEVSALQNHREALGEEECERSVPRFMSMDDVPVEKSRVEQAKKRPGRLASLFRFKKEKYAEMKREGDKYEF